MLNKHLSYFCIFALLSIVQGYSVIDTNNERVKEVLFFAATTVSEQIRNSTNNSLAEFRVVSAANQVATGFKMELEFQGDRRKTRLQPIKCKVIVFEWANNSRKMTSCSCCKPTTTSTTTRLPSVTDEPLLNMTNSSMRYQQYDVFFFLMFISLMQYLLYNVFWYSYLHKLKYKNGYHNHYMLQSQENYSSFLFWFNKKLKKIKGTLLFGITLKCIV